MRIQMLNRTDAEKVFGTYYNCTASTMAKDAVAQLDVGASQDGSRITTPTTNYLDLVIGIVDAAIATLSYGEVQIYGYRGTSAIRSSTDDAAGLKLLPIAGSTWLSTGGGAGDGRDGHFCLMSSIVSSSAAKTVSVPVFIRCM